MINNDILKGKWTEIKGEILTHWGMMSDDEIEKSNGNIVSIIGLIQQRYGVKKEEVQEKLQGIMARITDKTEFMKSELRKNETLH